MITVRLLGELGNQAFEREVQHWLLAVAAACSSRSGRVLPPGSTCGHMMKGF